jgi:hypothetical protein
MLIEVPRSLIIWPADGGDLNEMLTFGLNGLRGLGQDDSAPTDLSDAPLGGDPTYTDITGTTYTPTVTSSPSSSSNYDSFLYGTTSTSSSSSSTLAQDLTAAAPLITASAKAIAAATGPYAIPGTNYVYNPATGQMLLNGAAVGTYNPATGQLTALGTVSSYLPLLLGIGAVLALVMVMGGRK